MKSPRIFVIAKADLTFADGRKLSVDVREDEEALVNAWDTPGITPEREWRRGTRITMIIDGRIYRDVVGLEYVDPDGRRYDALDGGAR